MGGYTDSAEILYSQEIKDVVASRPKRDGARAVLASILGIVRKDKSIDAACSPNERDIYCMPRKWVPLMLAPFRIGGGCCNEMKKNPAKRYEKETGRVAITAQMANESILRLQKWLTNGCNAFESKKKISNPMAFWTEQDVLLYIAKNKLEICKVYGDIVGEDGTTVNCSNLGKGGLFDLEVPLLHTTGCNRTGCMFCGFGCHLEKPGDGRFLKMKKSHPKQYEYIMKPCEEGGLGYKEIIDWINENCHCKIEY